MFSKYHYLSHTHNNAARVFIATVNDIVCGYCSVLPFPHPFKKGFWREHRTVILPDYQGIGLGHLLSNNVAEILKESGKGFLSTTSAPSLIMNRKKDKKWAITRIGRVNVPTGTGLLHNKHNKDSTSANRITVSFQYIG